jgi:hypothetical protein
MVIERQLGGKLDRTFGAEGLDARLTIPLTLERWPGRVTGGEDVALPGTEPPPVPGQDNLK